MEGCRSNYETFNNRGNLPPILEIILHQAVAEMAAADSEEAGCHNLLDHIILSLYTNPGL